MKRLVAALDVRKYWLAFSLVPGIGPKRLLLLAQAFGDLSSAWQASESQLRAAGLDAETTASLLRMQAQLDLDGEMSRIERASAHLLTPEDDAYPDLLRNLPDAPLTLYMRGTLVAQDELALAVVGTRKASGYGRDATAYFSRQLAAQGVTIVSGLAHGIDAVAHRNALEAGGRTIAVMGCGIDRIYPPDHAELARQIVQNGALVSEFPLGTKPEARNFPRRNRIISGVSLGVLIVEAPEQSGAMITATLAAEQGKEVFAVPGSVFNAASVGTNRLIQDGAKLVITVDDILDELNIARRKVEARALTKQIAPTGSSVGEQERAVLAFLNSDPLPVDELALRSSLPASELLGVLTLLELQGYVEADGRGNYRRIGYRD
ncbi:MAG: DNA-protecting protein DprA [Anaerolineae bacterium]|nr:DNA-protecting protein DprA [Anaerolineae bacterium]